MSRTSVALLAALAAAYVGAARADEPPPTDGGLAAALAGLATVDSALVAWANSEHVDSDVKRTVLEAPPFGGEIPQADPSRGLTAEAAAQGILGVAEQRLGDLESKIERRQLELVFGATAQPEAPHASSEVEEERFGTGALARGVAPASLPFVGIPIAGSPANDDHLKSEEPGFDPDRIHEIVALDLADEPNATLDALGGALGVRASPAAVARVRESLGALVELATRRVQVDLRAWRVSRELRAGIIRLSRGVALTDEAEKKLAKEGTLAGSETLVTADGRVARSWRGETRTYIADAAGVGTGSTDTLARAVHTGIFAEVVPRIDPGAASATVSLRFALVEPGESSAARFMNTDIELPRLAVARTATTAVVPLGRTVLVGGSFETGAAGPPGCVVSLRATLLAEHGGPAARPAAATSRPGAERALVALDKETKAEVARLSALVPVIESALDRIRTARERRMAIFDVRDLVVGDTGALGLPRLGIMTTGTPEPDATPSGLDLASLQSLLRRSTGGDEAWAPPAWLAVGRGAILARQTPGSLTQIEGILASLRKERGGQVEVESGLYRTSDALAAHFSGVLDRDALARLDAAVARGDAKLVAGGFALARSGEAVTVLAADELAYLAGSATGPLGSATSVGLVRSGFRLGVRARRGRGGIDLEVDTSEARLRGVAHREGPNGTLHEPRLEVDSGTRELVLEDGTGFASPASSAGDEPLVLVVRARAP